MTGQPENTASPALLTADNHARVRHAVTLGLARQPLPVPAALAPLLTAAGPAVDPARTVLTLIAQSRRFERQAPMPSLSVPNAAQQMHADARPILPSSARRALIRLSNAVAKGQSNLAMQAAVARINQAGFRPHPFDLPWLIPEIKGNVACLGLAERAYLALTETAAEAGRPNILHAQITLANWCDFPKGHRRAFLNKERARDPAAARALLEGVFKSEPAPIRGELLESMSVGLSAADLPFLESLTGDRAESVKTVAARLIGGIPGTPAYAVRLAAAAACFQKSGGIASVLSKLGLGSPGEVVFVPLKTGNRSEHITAVSSLFGAISLPELTAATGLPSAKLLDALPDDGMVFENLMAAAVAADDEATRAILFEHKVSTATASELGLPAHTLHHLALMAPGPLSLPAADALMGSPGWNGLIARLSSPDSAGRDEQSLLFAAMIVSALVMPRLLSAIEPIPPMHTRGARAFAEMVTALALPDPSQSQPDR